MNGRFDHALDLAFGATQREVNRWLRKDSISRIDFMEMAPEISEALVRAIRAREGEWLIDPNSDTWVRIKRHG
jgi:hypothetical protein